MQRTFQDRLQMTKERGFIGRKEEIEFFGKILDQKEPDYLILLTHGIGGVGKSWLLNQIELQARQRGRVTAKVDDDQVSVDEILKKFRDDLVKQGFRLKEFDESYQRFRQLKSETEKALSQWKEKRDEQIAHTAGRITGKGAAAIAKLFFPSRAALEFFGGDEKLEQITVDAFGFLVKYFKTQEERDFLENPLLQLTRSFIKDINAICEKKQVILLFDTYEKLSKYSDEWLCHTFLKQPLSDQVLLAIAGREQFSPRWLEYEPLLKQRSLEVFTAEEARTYLFSRGITDPQTVEDILKVSGRLPVYLAMLAIQSDGSVQELDTPLEPVVERFLRGISTGNVNHRDAVLRCAFPRFFDKDIVKWMIGSENEAELFDWLHILPFVYRKQGGWRYHEIVRTQLLRYKWQESRDEYGELHRKVLAYYREHSEGEMFPEELYHRMCTDPDQGFRFGLGSLARVVRQNGLSCDVFLSDVSSEVLNVLKQTEEERGWENKWSHQGMETINQIISHDLRLENMWKQVGEDESLNGLVRTEAYFMRAHLLEVHNRLEEAEENYRKAIELNPEHVDTYHSLGHLLQVLDRLEEAEENYRKAIKLNSDYAGTYHNLGHLLQVHNRLEEAEENYRKAIELNPDYADAYHKLGHLLQVLDRLEEAKENYRKAIELRPDDIWAYAHLSWLFYCIDDWDQCIQASRQAFTIDPTQTWIQFNLALALLCQGNIDDAKVEYQKGMREANAENLKSAITNLEEAVKKNPKLIGAKEILAELKKL